jgi:hypothetical protein
VSAEVTARSNAEIASAGTTRMVSGITSARIPRAETTTLRLRLGAHAARLCFEVRSIRTLLSYALSTGLIEEAKSASGPWILFAPHVPGPIGHHLAAQHVNYADAAGSCHLERDGLLVAHIEGKKLARERRGRHPRAASTLAYQGAQPHLVHPLLVYTELLSSTEARRVWAASLLRERFLAKVA